MAIKIFEMCGSHIVIDKAADHCNAFLKKGYKVISVSHAALQMDRKGNPFKCEYHILITYDDRK